MSNPFSQPQVLNAVQRGLIKGAQPPAADIESEARLHFDFMEATGRPVMPPAKVLDLGCGAGDTVKALVEMGYDASGVDLLEFWDRDFDQYWNDQKKPAGEYLQRLRVIDPSNYRLPYPDAYFDFVMSNQVLEHVFNYDEVFRELARVLKPGAISCHRFPGPNTLMEGHINVPFPVLCRFRPYLAAWALLGRRTPRQSGLDWRQTLAANIAMMAMANYPTKRFLRRRARLSNVEIEFHSVTELAVRKIGRVARVREKLPRFLRAASVRCLSTISQRFVIIRAAKN